MAATRKRVWRAAFIAATVGVATLAVTTAVYIITPSEAGEGVPVKLSVAWALLGVIWAATGAANNITELRKRRPRNNARELLLRRVIRHDDSFVDRVEELRDMSTALVNARCINCHGYRGTGKSHLLGYLADVINEHRPQEAAHPVPVGFDAAIYFDMADAAGFDQFVQDHCTAAFTQATSWLQFVSLVDDEFGNERVLLVLDNVNLKGLWPSVGRAAYTFLTQRQSDAVVLGSVDPMQLYNLAPTHIPVDPFGHEAVRALVETSRSHVTQGEVDSLYDETGGLAVFLHLILANQPVPHRNEEALEHFLTDQVFPELSPDAVRLLAAIAVLAHIRRIIMVQDLRVYPVGHFRSALNELTVRSLVTAPVVEASGGIRMHDTVRDAAIGALSNQVRDAAQIAVDEFASCDRVNDAAIVSLHCDPDTTELDISLILRTAIDAAVSSRNYALLHTVANGYATNDALMRYMRRDPRGRELMAYAQAAALTGEGRYQAAEAVLLEVGMPSPGWDDTFLFNFRYLLADLTHLQNRYDEAFEMFHDLYLQAAAGERLHDEAKCQWALGHVLRHQCDMPTVALEHFDAATLLARQCGDLGSEVLAVTNAVGLRVYLNDLLPDERGRLHSLERRVTSEPDRASDQVKVWKALSRIEWLDGRQQEARRYLDLSLERALELNDRGVYNIYFEQAEYDRISSQLALAKTGYKRVLTFGEQNYDRNLIANSQLGIVLCEALSCHLDDVSARHRLRADVFRARQIAMDANTSGTVHEANRIARAIETKDARELQSVRLIVF